MLQSSGQSDVKNPQCSVPTRTECVLPVIVRVSSTYVAAVAEWYRYRTVACFVTGSSPVPLKTRRVGQRCTLNLSRAETSSRWCGVVVRRGGASSSVVHVTCPWFKITWSVAKSPRAAEQCDVNIQSINQSSTYSHMHCEEPILQSNWH
ncbi:uncharacterized protein TNCV_3529001 [Trichonephila clavipes]|nr:uncharacterized protein TNCV_3529001 [Trichonephila clavipes]